MDSEKDVEKATKAAEKAAQSAEQAAQAAEAVAVLEVMEEAREADAGDRGKVYDDRQQLVAQIAALNAVMAQHEDRLILMERYLRRQGFKI